MARDREVLMLFEIHSPRLVTVTIGSVAPESRVQFLLSLSSDPPTNLLFCPPT